MLAYTKKLAWIASVVLLSALGGCEGDNEVNGGEKPCDSNAQCTVEGKGVCDLTPATGKPVCVQCTPGTGGDATACTGATPTCGEDRTCRKCQAHTDCSSDACLPTGACAAEAEVIYLRENGTGTMCSKGTACGAWNAAMAALTPMRRIIRATGSLTVTDDVNNRNFTILGDASTVFRSAPGKDTFAIRGGMASNIEIYDSRIPSSEKSGVDNDSAMSTVKLVRCKVTGAVEQGVSVRKGTVEVSESEVSGNTRRGAFVEAEGNLKMTRSLVASNSMGGVGAADGGKVNITASFIVKNTTNGGIQVSNPGVGSVVSFNTIVDNIDAGGGNGDTGGVLCDNSAFTFRYNIIFRNRGGVGDQQTFGACMFLDSYIQAAAANDMRLNFKATDDYHLTASSPSMVKDVSGVTCTGLVDYDGEDRPQGAACDLGADEFKP